MSYLRIHIIDMTLFVLIQSWTFLLKTKDTIKRQVHYLKMHVENSDAKLEFSSKNFIGCHPNDSNDNEERSFRVLIFSCAIFFYILMVYHKEFEKCKLYNLIRSTIHSKADIIVNVFYPQNFMWIKSPFLLKILLK